MDHPLRPAPSLSPSLWRSAAVVASLVAVVELALLIAAGVALLTRDGGSAPTRHQAPAAHARPAKAHPARSAGAEPAAKALPRTKVGVVVLNGNGRAGAAAAAAARVHHHGYRIRKVGNATRMSYAHSLVMFKPGFASEGRRFARDLGIRLVGPLDGMRAAQLRGAQVVLILGG